MRVRDCRLLSASVKRNEKAAAFGRWFGAVLKVLVCWAAVHVAFVADDEPRFMRAIAAIVLYFTIRDTYRFATLNQRLKDAKL